MADDFARFVMFRQIAPKDDYAEYAQQERQRAERERRVIQEAERKALRRASE